MDRFQQLRVLEALLFSSASPIDEKTLAARLPDGVEIGGLIEELQGRYANRGVQLGRVGKGWAFRTAADLAPYLRVESEVKRRPSRAAVETLAIIAYHQPITRAEIEEMRGVTLSRGTLETLLEAGWVRPRGRRRTPGRPVTWGTSEKFLDHFGIESLDALPGIEELKAAGLLDRRPGFGPLNTIDEKPVSDEPEDGQDDEAATDEVTDEEILAVAEALSDEELGASAEVVELPVPARRHGTE